MISFLKKLFTAHRNKNIGEYMDRWFIIPPEWKLPYCVRLQHIKMEDTRYHHTHPYEFYSMVLCGMYVEEIVLSGEGPCFHSAIRSHKPFKWFRMKKDDPHKILYIPKEGVWTLIIMRRKERGNPWHFLINDNGNYRLIPQEEYKRRKEFLNGD